VGNIGARRAGEKDLAVGLNGGCLDQVVGARSAIRNEKLASNAEGWVEVAGAKQGAAFEGFNCETGGLVNET